MDHQRDFEAFKRLLSRLCVTFDKFATEELIEAWWKALRREPFPAIERQIDCFIASANDKTKFPKPGQFAGASGAQAYECRVTEASERAWRTFIERFPRTGPIRSAMAVASQIMAREHESTPAYANAHSEYLALERQLGPGGRFAADA
jgi:hypothetical protein